MKRKANGSSSCTGWRRDDLPACLEKFAACDLPNLWKPKADAFFRVENFPLLGTGKLDLRAVKGLAAKLAV